MAIKTKLTFLYVRFVSGWRRLPLPSVLRVVQAEIRPHELRHFCQVAGHKEGGGDGGIRTLDRPLQAYNGLANRRLQPLGHVSNEVDMPEARLSRKRQFGLCAKPCKAD
jgi:hypothetical protein